MTKGIGYVFDATQHDPALGAPPPVPAATYGAAVTETAITDLADDKGWAFVVKAVITDEGPHKGHVLRKQYNLGHKLSSENCRISHNELAALSYVTGVFKIDMNNEGAALRDGRFRVRVENDGKYNEWKEVFDINGNKPNKAGTGYGAPQTAPVASAQPQGGGWAQPAAPAPAAPPAPQTGWAPPAAPAPVAQPPQQYAAPIPPAAPVAQPQAPAWNQAAPAAPTAGPAPWGPPQQAA